VSRGIARLARVGGATAALSAALVLGLAAPASAHDYVVDSTPSDGATITALPEAWTVTANNPLLTLEGNDGAFAIVVTDAEGLYYGDGCVEVSGATMTAPAVLGEPGAYEMTFQYVSSDGHTLSETYAFTYAPEAEEPVTEGSAAAPSPVAASSSAPVGASPPSRGSAEGCSPRRPRRRSSCSRIGAAPLRTEPAGTTRAPHPVIGCGARGRSAVVSSR